MPVKRFALAAVVTASIGAVALGEVSHQARPEKAASLLPPLEHVVSPANEVVRRVNVGSPAISRDVPSLTAEQRGRIEPSLALLTNLERYAAARDDRALLARIHTERGRLIQATMNVGERSTAERALK